MLLQTDPKYIFTNLEPILFLGKIFLQEKRGGTAKGRVKKEGRKRRRVISRSWDRDLSTRLM